MQKILQMKISLKGLKPLIWRRFLVEDSINFHKLHEVIQRVMGWVDYHLYEFRVDDVCIEAEKGRAFAVDFIWGNLRPEVRETKYTYLYDFGDSWKHSIVVEKILEKDESKRYPVCIAGKRACPPEDCGGV